MKNTDIIKMEMDREQHIPKSIQQGQEYDKEE